MKVCSKCNKEKLETDFTKHGSYCKSCVSAINKLYRQNNKEKCKSYKKQEKHKAKTKEYKRSKKYKNWEKEYYQNNKERINQYYIDNKEKISLRTREWEKNKIISDPKYKLRKNISAYLKSNLKNKNKESTLKYLPYSLNELKQHLESLFEPWMNWNNHGSYKSSTWDDNDQTTWKWNIDHIIPHSLFDYNNIQDDNFKKCWSLSNLRPYSAKQNIIDGTNRTRHRL